MKAVEYTLDFQSKVDAENALDYFENQPGYQGGSVTLPSSNDPRWHIRICFSSDSPLLGDRAVLLALKAVNDPPAANAG